MSDELKACPFCGKSDIHIEQKGTFFWCECYDCGAISREHHTLPGVNVLQSEDIARGYWNNRPIEDELQARIAELEAENAMLKQLPQPIKFWSDEKKQIYKINESRTMKSGYEEREE